MDFVIRIEPVSLRGRNMVWGLDVNDRTVRSGSSKKLTARHEGLRLSSSGISGAVMHEGTVVHADVPEPDISPVFDSFGDLFNYRTARESSPYAVRPRDRAFEEKIKTLIQWSGVYVFNLPGSSHGEGVPCESKDQPYLELKF